MKNLENFGVQELNAKDKKNINGGSWLGNFLLVAAILVVGFFVAANNDNVQF